MSTRVQKLPMSKLKKLALVFGGLALAAITVLVMMMLLDGPAPKSNKAAAVFGPTPTTSSSAPLRTNCPTGPARFEQGDKYEVIKGGLPTNDIVAAKAKLLEAAKTNPVFVAGMAVERKFNDGKYIDAQSLVKDGCWTTEGQTLSIKIQGAVEASTATYATADPNRRNSGGDSGKFVVSEQTGISGDLQSVRMMHADGSYTEVLTRCSNFTFEGDVPHIPRGRTDNDVPGTTTPGTPGTSTPPVTTTTTTPPTYVCPPGQVGTPPNCIEQKVDSQQPQNNGNVPTNVGDGGETHVASPTDAQPVEPPAPPPVYTAPPASQTQQPPAQTPTSNQGAPTSSPVTGDPCVTDPSLPFCG